MLQKCLFVGDAACGSGFGKASHYLLQVLDELMELVVIGVNYRGDPHKNKYPIYPAWPGGDALGVKRIKELVPTFNPDLVVLQTNPWNVPLYGTAIPKETPMVGIIAVEGKNCEGHVLNKLRRAIFWTEFGRNEAIQGGMTCSSSIVPLGVDLDMFQPGDKREARIALGLPEQCWDAFIIGNINRNQNRKRLDLSIQYFAKWWHTHGQPDAYLYLHTLPGSSKSCDCEQLAKYYGVQHRLILVEPKNIFHGVSEKAIAVTQQAFDIGLSTTYGEGWGLTAMEGMACGIPYILPRYAAFGEWASDGALMVPCFLEGVMPDVHQMIGGVPDEATTIRAIELLYSDKLARATVGARGLALVSQPQYRWENIAQHFAKEIATVEEPAHVA